MNTEILRESLPESKTRPIRVLHVLDHGWPVHTGYSIRSRHLTAAQLHLGIAPQVLTGPLQEVDDPEAKNMSVDGVSYWRTPQVGAVSKRAVKHSWSAVRAAAVVRLIERGVLGLLECQPFDIIHAHSPALCGLGALRAARSKGIPFVYELRAFWEDAAVDQNKTHTRSLRYALSQKLEDYVVRRADAVVGISRFILEELTSRKADPRRLFYVPNGVDSGKFTATPRDESLAKELGLSKELVIGFIGSLYRWEGVEWLVRAVVELRRRGTACKLLVVGDGEEMSTVRNAVRQLNAENFVILMGRISHDDVQRYYSLMDAMVYPRHSIRLTELITPLKPLEAMALGKAILGSDVGGIRELIETEKTGLLFRADHLDDFCRQAQRLLADAALRRRLGEEAHNLIVREKDWKIIAQRYLTVYEAAVQNFRLTARQRS